jgi:putative glutathione S-transferase
MSSGSFTLGQEATDDGEFVRQQSQIRDWVSADGSTGYPAAPGRYHLYVALACPWSHRAVIVRKLKRLEDVIGISYIHPFRDDRGWAFPGGEFTDDLHGWDFLGEGYEQTIAGYDGRVSVPVLWDRERGRIVSNESADIVRMLNSEFDEWGDASVDLYPEDLRAEIDELDDYIYDNVNNAVYRAGFAESQRSYERAYRAVFDALPTLDERLATRRYLLGDRITEADWRLFVTLVRFDAVYNLHFRCNGARIIDYPNLWGYTRDLYQQPGVAETVAMDEIKRHYYTTHDMLNPKRIIPAGPEQLDFSAPHGRG